MFLRQFKIKVIIQVIFLILVIFLFSYLALNTTLYATMFILVITIITQTFTLIKYVQRTNLYLTRFLDSIKHSDFTTSFSLKELGSSFSELARSFTEVMNAFQNSRSEKEEHYRYLQTVVQHIGAALLAFDKSGRIELINTAAKRLLKINQAKNIYSIPLLDKKLIKKICKMKTGEKLLAKVTDDNETMELAVSTTIFKLQGVEIFLISLHDIRSELEEKEMEAWQNLIRVLTHEIMNSITPIASLASTVNGLLANGNEIDEEKHELKADTIQDISDAVYTIEKRSQGLLHFVESYRQLTRIPAPKYQLFKISSLFNRIQQLMSSNISDGAIELIIKITPKELELTADPELIEQVLINLVKNAIDALKDTSDPQIKLTAKMDARSRIVLQVCDNGPGILKENKEQIFIPFFTTKKTGSGIGLSLSRQVMRAHRGSITLNTQKGKKTEFVLKF